MNNFDLNALDYLPNTSFFAYDVHDLFSGLEFPRFFRVRVRAFRWSALRCDFRGVTFAV